MKEWKRWKYIWSIICVFVIGLIVIGLLFAIVKMYPVRMDTQINQGDSEVGSSILGRELTLFLREDPTHRTITVRIGIYEPSTVLVGMSPTGSKPKGFKEVQCPEEWYRYDSLYCYQGSARNLWAVQFNGPLVSDPVLDTQMRRVLRVRIE